MPIYDGVAVKCFFIRFVGLWEALVYELFAGCRSTIYSGSLEIQRRHEIGMQRSAAIHADASRFLMNRRRHGIGVTAESTLLSFASRFFLHKSLRLSSRNTEKREGGGGLGGGTWGLWCLPPKTRLTSFSFSVYAA